MGIKNIFRKRKMAIGILAGLGLFLWAADILAEAEVEPNAFADGDYDIVRFRSKDKTEVGEKVEVKVEIQNKGSNDPGAVLHVVGSQGSSVFPLTPPNGLLIYDKPGGGEIEKKFTYFPISSGDIRWQAALDDGDSDIDEAFFTTKVVSKKDDDDEKDDEGDGPSASKNIIASHNNDSPQYNKNCTTCHADIFSEQSLDPSIRTAHGAMQSRSPGEKDDQKCVWCHKSVDLVQKSTGNLRRHVDAMLCALCHGSYERTGPSGPVTAFYQAGLSPDNPDGPLLYDLVCASCHNDLANSKVKGESAEEIQEKIDKNEGGMGPLNILLTEEIEAIADALAQ